LNWQGTKCSYTLSARCENGGVHSSRLEALCHGLVARKPWKWDTLNRSDIPAFGVLYYQASGNNMSHPGHVVHQPRRLEHDITGKSGTTRADLRGAGHTRHLDDRGFFSSKIAGSGWGKGPCATTSVRSVPKNRTIFIPPGARMSHHGKFWDNKVSLVQNDLGRIFPTIASSTSSKSLPFHSVSVST